MKKLLKIAAIVVAVLAAALLSVSYYMLDYSLKPENRGKDLDGSYEYMFDEYPFLEQWMDSLDREGALKDTFIMNNENMRMHAYYISSATGSKRTAVIVHGYTDNAIRMFMIGYMYNHDLDCNVLLPDLHYSGLSEGDYFRMGWKDRLDVLQWMDVADGIFGDSTRMVVHGISMGAATTMMVSGEQQKDYVRCFVEDCGYTSVWDEFRSELKARFGMPAFPLLHVADWMCKKKYGWSFREASALEQVRKCSYPMLFIHGDKDTFVPTYMVYDLYDAKPRPKELWITPGTGHALSYKDYKDEYTRKVSEFIERYM